MCITIIGVSFVKKLVSDLRKSVALPRHMFKIGVGLTTKLTITIVMVMSAFGKSAIPCGPLLYHLKDASIISGHRSITSVGGFVIYGM